MYIDAEIIEHVEYESVKEGCFVGNAQGKRK